MMMNTLIPHPCYLCLQDTQQILQDQTDALRSSIFLIDEFQYI